MKLKITEVVKTYDPNTRDGITSYAVWAKINVNGTDKECMVRCYSDKIVLVAGQEYTSNENCGEIKETQSQKGNPIYTIKVKPKERSFSSRSSSKSFSKEQFADAVQFAFDQANVSAINEKAEFWGMCFSSILKNYCDSVDPSKSNVEKTTENYGVPESAPEKNPFDDDDIPF